MALRTLFQGSAALMLLLVACGGDDFQAAEGSAGAAGDAGSGGSTAGRGGSGGGAGSTAGSSGTGGATGGSAGASGAGAGGKGGAAGTGGAGSGGAGSGGTAGAAGTAGGPGGSAGAGGAGAAGAAGTAGTAGTAGAAGTGGAGCGADPDPATGVYVAPTGSDGTGDGSPGKPYATINKALSSLGTKTRLYLAPASYDGAVSITAALSVEGGWTVTGDVWKRDCAADARTKTTLTSTAENKPVVFASTTAVVSLKRLTVKTKAKGASKPDASGESVIGILARAGVKLGLSDVDVIAGIGGDGGVASPGENATGASACTGTGDCATGDAGADGADGKAPAGIGQFGDAGYTPADGGAGVDGSPGANGKTESGQSADFCATCVGTTSADCSVSGYTTNTTTAEAGKCGCGGLNSAEPTQASSASAGTDPLANPLATKLGGEGRSASAFPSGLIRYVRDGSDPAFWKGVVGSNGTLHDSTHWSSSSSVLLDPIVDPKADLPTAVTRMLDSGCYAAVQKAAAKAKSDVDKLTHLFVSNMPIWQTLPDGGDGPDGYKGFNLGVDLPASTYNASIQAQALESRLSVFGVRPTKQTGFALAPGAPPPPPAPKKKALQGPETTPTKPAPPAPPKFGKDQFLEAGTVYAIDWNSVDPKFVAAANPCGVPPQDAAFSVDACTCAADALLYLDVDSLPKTFLGQPLPPLFRSDAPFERWSDFFQGKVFPSPETTCRPVDDLSVEVGGSKALWAAAKSSTGDPKKAFLGVAWNLRSRLADLGWTAPPGTQLFVPPGSVDKDPYKAGLFLLAPWKQGEDWVFATGAWYSVLYGHGSLQRKVLDTWTWEAGGTVGFAARYDGPTGYFGLPPAGSPVATGWAWPGMQDYAEGLVPKAEASASVALDLEKPSKVVASAHLYADPWHPGDDLWATNYGNVSEFDTNVRQRAPRLPGFEKAPAQSNSIGWQWYPRATYADAESGIVESYASRIAKCDIDNYRPFKADKHWPRVMTQVPQASLWGHASGGPETLFATDLVWQFGTGSTALHDARLHEGLDVNWRFKADPFVDPAYRGIYGNVADTYCFGKSLLTGDVEVPLKCPVPDPNNEGKYLEEDKDNPIAHCPTEQLEAKDEFGNYDDDSGCNPAERIWEDIKAKCGGQLKSCTDVCESWGPLKVICWVGSCTYAGFKTIAECSNELWVSQADLLGAYLGTLGCQAIDAVPCSPNQLRLFRRHDGNQHHEMEIELEHRLTYGKKDGLDLCEPAFNGGCAYQEGYKPGNEYHGNGINVSLDKDLKSLFDAPTGPAQVYPFTNIPGMVNQSSGVLARFAQTSGFSDTPPPVLGIVPDAVAQFAALPQNSKHPLLQMAFRAQFIGDLIVDCGHNPIRTEIHPPTNILLHATPHPDLLSASGVAASPVRRYTLWGWKRHNDFTSPPSYDLWPGPRPKGATSIAFKILQPVGASQLTGFSCSPVPSYAPNRIVCVPSGGGATSGQQDMVCAHNPRMLPSCAETSGGSLVEVYWQ